MAILIDRLAVPGATRRKGKELISRVRAGRCELCEQRAEMHVHHVRALADLTQPGRPQPAWAQLMAKRRRKTLVVCRPCHDRTSTHPINHHVAGPLSVDPGWAPAHPARLPPHVLAPEAPDGLNHTTFRLTLRRPILRRILVGVKVVRPRCAAGAPPRPRLRSTAPGTGAGTRPHNADNQRIPTFTGVRNTDKKLIDAGAPARGE